MTLADNDLFASTHQKFFPNCLTATTFLRWLLGCVVFLKQLSENCRHLKLAINCMILLGDENQVF